jgi:hypothetical protein
MTASAAIVAVTGLALSFAPAEIVAYLGSAPNPALSVLLQVAGAAFLGFAILNWMARESVIGGIYNRPLALGNFLHFGAGAIAAGKSAFAGHTHELVVVLGVVYALLACGFGFVIFGNARIPSDNASR